MSNNWSFLLTYVAFVLLTMHDVVDLLKLIRVILVCIAVVVFVFALYFVPSRSRFQYCI